MIMTDKNNILAKPLLITALAVIFFHTCKCSS